MRKKILILFLVLSIQLFGQGEEIQKFFDKYSGKEGYTSVYVSRFMFDMLRNMDVQLDEVEVQAALDHINSIIILTKEGEAGANFRTDLVNVLPNGYFEVLMRIKEGQQDVTFLVREDKGRISEFVMVLDAPTNPSLIYITADITLEELSKLSAAMNITGFKNLSVLGKSKEDNDETEE